MALWGILEIITMMTNRRRRSLHDYIAGSVVIKTDYCDSESLTDTALPGSIGK